MKKMRTLCGLVCLLLCVALCACSNGSSTSGKTVDVKAAMEEIKGTYEFSDVNDVTDNMLMSVYGIDQKNVKSYAGLTDASAFRPRISCWWKRTTAMPPKRCALLCRPGWITAKAR